MTTGNTADVSSALREAHQQLKARDLRLKVESIKSDGDTATATFRARMWLDGIGRKWSYNSRLKLRRTNGSWKVLWSPHIIHPRLGEDEKLAVVSDLPTRAPILGAEGKPLVQATPVVTIGLLPRAVTNRHRTISVLARTTKADPERMRSLIQHADPDTFVSMVTLRRSVYKQIRYQLDQLPGLRLKSATMPLPSTPNYARALLGGVGAVTDQKSPLDAPGQPGRQVRLSGLQLAFRQRLSGTPGSKVVALAANGRQTGVLARMPGQASRPVHTTINDDVQEAAEGALESLDEPAAVVAVRASTGDVLAVANRPAASTYNCAFTGKYRPGSAFNVVTADALLGNGLQPSSSASCPRERAVGGKTFRGSGSSAPGGKEGEESSLRTSFATSCTTAFAGLSSDLPPGALRHAAAAFGIGGHWKLPLPVFTGTVPRRAGDAAKASTAVGEGGVRVSPLAMALAAAAADSGRWHPPTLVTKPRQEAEARTRPLPDDRVEQLHQLLRASVESGTAEAVDLRGEQVYGTAGTAERPEGAPHSWFLGFRGDIACAVLVEGGGKGAAAPVAADFFRDAPSSH